MEQQQRSCSGVVQHAWSSCPTSEGGGKGCYKGGGEQGMEQSRLRRCTSPTKKKKNPKKPEGRKKKKSLKSSGAGEASSAHFKVVAPGAVFICAPAQAAPRSRWRSQWRGHGGALRPALRCASPALLLRPRGCAQGCACREGICEQRLLQSMLRLQGARAKHVYYS